MECFTNLFIDKSHCCRTSHFMNTLRKFALGKINFLYMGLFNMSKHKHSSLILTTHKENLLLA